MYYILGYKGKIGATQTKTSFPKISLSSFTIYYALPHTLFRIDLESLEVFGAFSFLGYCY